MTDVKSPAKPDVDGQVKDEKVSTSVPQTAEKAVLDILIADAATRAVEAETQRENNRRKAVARQKNATENELAKANRIRNCSHLKGGKNRNKRAAPDPSVYRHIFIDGTHRIRCFICSMEVCGGSVARGIPPDTAQFIYREFEGNLLELPNPTWNPVTQEGIGWEEALVLESQSTNKFSSSEIPSQQAAAAVAAAPQSQLTALQKKVDELTAALAAKK